MNIQELKRYIENLPDEMRVVGWDSSGEEVPITMIIITEDTLTEEEIRQGYPNGVTPTLSISLD